jgi:hypothetical protein
VRKSLASEGDKLGYRGPQRRFGFAVRALTIVDLTVCQNARADFGELALAR